MSANGLHRIQWPRFVKIFFSFMLKRTRYRGRVQCFVKLTFASCLKELLMLHAISAIVSPHSFKNDVYFTCNALVSPHGWEIFSLTREPAPESPIDSCQEELTPPHLIESVCLLFQPPSLLLTVTSGATDQAPCTHFHFRSRSDSTHLRAKTTRLRSSVLDMYDFDWLRY